MAKEEVSIVIRAKDLASRVFSGVAGGLKRVKVSAAGLRTAFLAVIASAGGLVFAFKKLFDTGSGVLETQSKFNTVFGASAERMDEFNKEFARTAGLTKTVGQELLATTGSIVQGLGFSTDASADFSKAVLRLAGDLGSFNNIPTAETARAIQAALTGEREQLKRLGIVVREADVKQRALALSGGNAARAATEQVRATASLQLITERAGKAVGDLNRTQHSAENRSKQVKAAFADQFNQLSTDLMPVLVELLPLFEELANKAEAATKRVAGFITVLFDLAGLTNSTLRKQLAAFGNLAAGQRQGLVDQLRKEIGIKQADIVRLQGPDRDVGGLGRGIALASAIQEEVEQLQIALDVLETNMARLKDTSDETAPAVDKVVDALKGGRPADPMVDALKGGRPADPTFAIGAPLQFGRSVRRSPFFRNDITRGNELTEIVRRQGEAEAERLAEEAKTAAQELDVLGRSVATNFSQMATAAISGSEQMEQAVIAAFTNILSSIPGVTGLGGALIGAVGGLFGGLFGRKREPTPVKIEDISDRAVEKQRRSAPDVHITIVDPRTNTRRILQDIRSLEARDGVSRTPASFG